MPPYRGAFLPSEIVDPDGLVEIEAADAGNDWTYYTRNARGNVLTRRTPRRPPPGG
ncbi:MAG TPA: hypothetical protein VGG06_09025 [Thermoanaerobaculia bacterium]